MTQPRRRDAQCLLPQPREQAGQQVDLADVGHADRERALGPRPLEVGALVQPAVEHRQRIALRLGELVGKRRRLHVLGGAQEQLVAEQLAQLARRVAHAGLRVAQVLGPLETRHSASSWSKTTSRFRPTSCSSIASLHRRHPW